MRYWAALIKEHLVTGEAVGSRVFVRQICPWLRLESATIRNVMGELEECRASLNSRTHRPVEFLLTRDTAYYVDNILGEARLSRSDLKEH